MFYMYKKLNGRILGLALSGLAFVGGGCLAMDSAQSEVARMALLAFEAQQELISALSKLSSADAMAAESSMNLFRVVVNKAMVACEEVGEPVTDETGTYDAEAEVELTKKALPKIMENGGQSLDDTYCLYSMFARYAQEHTYDRNVKFISASLAAQLYDQQRVGIEKEVAALARWSEVQAAYQHYVEVGVYIYYPFFIGCVGKLVESQGGRLLCLNEFVPLYVALLRGGDAAAASDASTEYGSGASSGHSSDHE